MGQAVTFAPDWVLLRDIEGWIETELHIACSIDATAMRRLIVAAVRHQHVVHRISGYWDAVRRLKGGEPILPEGVALQYLPVEPPKVLNPKTMRAEWSLSSRPFPVVTDWDAAGVDWNDGTIIGTSKRGRGPRLGVELFWLSVEDYFASQRTPLDVGLVNQHVDVPLAAPYSAKRTYSEPILRAWFSLRVATWPKGKAPPSEQTDLADAVAEFGPLPSRDRFREIRKEKTPPAWRKPGPRSGSL